MATSPTLSVFGSFGYGNVGDEAVLPSLGNLLRHADLARPLRGIARFREAVMPEIVYMKEGAEMARRGELGDRVFLVGGGIIEPSPNSCLNRLASFRDDKADFRIQPFAISCEPGVRFGLRERLRLSRTLADLPEVLVRDEISAATLRRILPRKPVRVIGDIVLWLEPEDLPAQTEAELPDRYVVVSLASVWDSPEFNAWLLEELREVQRRTDAHILLVPISNAVGRDVAQHQALLSALQAEGIPSAICLFGQEPVLRPGWVANVYGRAELVIASRLHGCVMAYSQRTPFVGIGYHHKVLGFARTVGWEDAVVPRTMPEMQSRDTYGFTVADLSWQQGALVAAADGALAQPDFSALDFYRMKQVQAVRGILS